MLCNTFYHIPGIGPSTEEKIWCTGIVNWDDIFNISGTAPKPKKVELIKKYIIDSKEHLQKNNPNYFEKLLPSKSLWRLFPEFRDSLVYLDIESTGLDRSYESITTIALYDGRNIYHYVKGQNLDDFLKDINKYNVIVSYNGKTFDIPFIETYFDIKLHHAHIDLRYVLGSMGYKGGLKKCEKAFGIDRGDLTGIDGYFAVILWHEYQKNKNIKTLETLLAYNIEDVLNLEVLMVKAYNLKIKDTPFADSHLIPLPSTPENTFQVDCDTVQRIKNKYYY